MARLIEIQATQDLPSSIAAHTGDILIFEATGGYVRSGAKVVELLGIFLRSVMGNELQILSPMGAPNAVVFLVCSSGSAKIDVVTCDPWHNPKTVSLEIIVSQ